MSISVGVEEGSVREGRSINSDIGWWKMSGRQISFSLQILG